MSKNKAVRLVESVLAHSLTSRINIALFLYRDFIEDHRELVSNWGKNPRIIFGIRGDSPKPQEYLRRLRYDFGIRNIILSSLRQLVRATGFSTIWFLPDVEGNTYFEKEIRGMKMNVLSNNVWVPPKDLSTLADPFLRSVRSSKFHHYCLQPMLR